ncbi:histidine kinase [Chitinophaga sp. Ak27]|uniref:histidine kinase n=1 Tax=Chitinophaga sp. Ak27 TaxID=2726116 RepID=UPI00145E00F9|nr:histidine kinase [Chitinophaga sp. Ak27]NLU91205.1 histidine kinase [Chitinophaga sp. Ak27]
MKSSYRYFIHLAIWMALLGLYAFPQLRVNWPSAVGLKWVLVHDVAYGFINFHLFYVLVFTWLPSPVKQRQYAKGVVGTLLIILLFAVIKFLVGYYLFPDQILQRMIALTGVPKIYMSFREYLPATIRTGLGVSLLAYGYRLFLQWRNTEPEDRMLATAATQARSRYDRMQEGSRQLLHHLQLLTPVLEDEQKREHEGTKAILILSDLLRYMLYDKALEKERVPLKKELTHFERYVELRNLLHPQQLLQLHTVGEASLGTIEGLRLQQFLEAGLQQWNEVAGSITIELTCSEHVVALSLAAPHQKSIHQHIRLFPDHG